MLLLRQRNENCYCTIGKSHNREKLPLFNKLFTMHIFRKHVTVSTPQKNFGFDHHIPWCLEQCLTLEESSKNTVE